MKLKIIDHSRHRNGVAGAPFEVVLFQVQREPGCKVGILFDDPGYCAILDVALLAAGAKQSASLQLARCVNQRRPGQPSPWCPSGAGSSRKCEPISRCMSW